MSRPNSPVSSRYGAPMGRHTGPQYLEPEAGPIRLMRVKLNRGGYDPGGAYWGVGMPLFYVEDQDGNSQYLRAASRETAKAKIAADWPGARFYK